MREIKFKGINVDTGKMVYGYLLQHRMLPVIFDENKEENKVYARTVGQYTGLKDKNGKEIYEGDIFRDINEPDTEGRIVFYNDELAAFMWHPINENEGMSTLMPDSEEIVIIGNTYENPELLKNGEK